MPDSSYGKASALNMQKKQNKILINQHLNQNENKIIMVHPILNQNEKENKKK